MYTSCGWYSRLVFATRSPPHPSPLPRFACLPTVYCWAIAASSLWITGPRPAEWHRIYQAGRNRRRRPARGDGRGDDRGRVAGPRAERRSARLEMGRGDKGISVCMALKLINRDETASVIKTGNVVAYVTSYFIRTRVFVWVCVLWASVGCTHVRACVCVFAGGRVYVWNVRLSENGVHVLLLSPQSVYKRPAIAYGLGNSVISFHPPPSRDFTFKVYAPRCLNILFGKLTTIRQRRV